MHILKLEEWQSGSGNWLCGDVSALAAMSNAWWYIPRLLSIPLDEYIKLLITKYHAINLHYTAKDNVLIFYFKTQSDARKFKNEINKIAREKKFYTY